MSDRRTGEEQVRDELALLRRVVARHIRDGYDSAHVVQRVLASSLETEIEMAGIRLDVADVLGVQECTECARRSPTVADGDRGPCAACRARRNCCRDAA